MAPEMDEEKGKPTSFVEMSLPPVQHCGADWIEHRAESVTPSGVYRTIRNYANKLYASNAVHQLLQIHVALDGVLNARQGERVLMAVLQTG